MKQFKDLRCPIIAMSATLPVLVATEALELGVDNPNITQVS